MTVADGRNRLLYAAEPVNRGRLPATRAVQVIAQFALVASIACISGCDAQPSVSSSTASSPTEGSTQDEARSGESIKLTACAKPTGEDDNNLHATPPAPISSATPAPTLMPNLPSDVETIQSTWWPDRPIFTLCELPDYITLNSIHDPRTDLDERRFFFLRREGDEEQLRETTIRSGDTFDATAYVWNDISPSSSAASVTEGARAILKIPRGVVTSSKAEAMFCADNARPACVSSTVVFRVANNRALELYVPPESVYWSTDMGGNFMDMKDLEDGALLGCRNLDGELDGRLDGTDQCRGYLAFKVQVREPRFEVHTSFTGKRVSGRVVPGDRVKLTVLYENVDSVARSLSWMGARLSPGVTVDLSSVSIDTWDSRISQWRGRTLFPDDAVRTDADRFWTDVSSVVEAGDKVVLNVDLDVSVEGEYACGGDWLSIDGFAYSEEVPLEDKRILATESTC